MNIFKEVTTEIVDTSDEFEKDINIYVRKNLQDKFL